VLAVGTVVVEPFTHLGRAWAIVEIGGSFFARSDQVPLAAEGPIEGSDIGPYGTAAEARAWVDAIDTSWSSTPPGEKPEHPAMPAKPETPAREETRGAAREEARRQEGCGEEGRLGPTLAGVSWASAARWHPPNTGIARRWAETTLSDRKGNIQCVSSVLPAWPQSPSWRCGPCRVGSARPCLACSRHPARGRRRRRLECLHVRDRRECRRLHHHGGGRGRHLSDDRRPCHRRARRRGDRHARVPRGMPAAPRIAA
jgi:hypothetical protein